jgi:hypothetical protein
MAKEQNMLPRKAVVVILITLAAFSCSNNIETKEKDVSSASTETTNKDYYEEAISFAIQASEKTQTAQQEAEWNNVKQLWQQSLSALQSIPEGSTKYTEAQTKISEYTKNLEYSNSQAIKARSAEYYAQAINFAIQASEKAKTAQQEAEWNNVKQLWQESLSALQSIPEGSTKYTEAQTKISEYTKNLEYSNSQAIKATPEGQGWSEKEDGIYGRWCKENCNPTNIADNYAVYEIWCKERACGDVYIQANLITSEGTVIGWTNETGYGDKGQKIQLTLDSYEKNFKSFSITEITFH